MNDVKKLLARIGAARDAISRKEEQTGLDFMIDGVLMNCAVMLKEQEAVKPYIDIDEAKCPICKVKLTRQELLGDDVLFEDFFDYCPHCGREVKWE